MEALRAALTRRVIGQALAGLPLVGTARAFENAAGDRDGDSLHV